MRAEYFISKIIGLYLLTGIAYGATIPSHRPVHQEGDINPETHGPGTGIPAGKHQLLKRTPNPQYPPRGSNENSLDDIDPRERGLGNREEDERSNGPWDMFGNLSPDTLDDLRIHRDLVPNPAPQNMGLGLGLIAPRPVINVNPVGGNAPQQQAVPQDDEDGSEVEEEEKSNTEIEEEEKEGTEIHEQEREDTEIEEEKEGTEIEEEEKEASEQFRYEPSEISQRSQNSIQQANSAAGQSPDYIFPGFQRNFLELSRRPSLLESPSIHSRFAPSSGGRSRSSPTRVGRRRSGVFGNFDPSTIRDASGEGRLYGIGRNRRQSASSPSVDLLDFGGNSLLSRFNSGEGPLMRPVTLNFGHESAYPQNVQTTQLTENRDFMRDDLFSQSLDDDFPAPRGVVSQSNQPDGNGQPPRGATLVDVTGGLGGAPVYRQEEVKEESYSSGLDSDST
ncbi:hypothetical protein TWF718_004543 [Orbilia javanica]|uniref:Uncharacterized protein n=1 Tax=Orbilia javanica TaxID=47235 RepID=A0AAN8N2V8_9PEZI